MPYNFKREEREPSLHAQCRRLQTTWPYDSQDNNTLFNLPSCKATFQQGPTIVAKMITKTAFQKEMLWENYSRNSFKS